MVFKKSFFFILFLQSTGLFAQLPFGHEKAIYKDSAVFVSWATGCSVQRGFQNISDEFLGYASAGDSSMAIGKADGSGVVSLGDGGTAVLTFAQPIINGTGYDFAVFENGFPFGMDSLFFLELAFVEVSSDGQHFFRFTSSSLTDTLTQVDNATGINPKAITNLAGKYIVNYGTPFDLDEMKNISGLDVNHITHVKIIDVVGSIDNFFARRDASARKINDPWPTPFESSGFDLDAVGVLHQLSGNGIFESASKNEQIQLYPMPLNGAEELHIICLGQSTIEQVELYDLSGKIIMMQPSMGNKLTMQLSQFDKGIYLLKIIGSDFVSVKKITIE